MDTSERIAKLEAQMESIKEDVAEMKADVKQDIRELHSRITTGNRELMDKFEQKIDELAKSDKDQHESLKKSMDNVKDRVDVLEKWRWMIVGGAIVIGYLIGHLNFFSKIFGA